MSNNKWGYNLYNSDNWQCEWFETKEEAIQAGRNEHEEYELDSETFQVGQLSKYVPPKIDLDTIIDDAVVQAYDDCGEVSESWLNIKYISKDVLHKFNEKLNHLFNEFLIEANEVPEFGRIINIETVGVDE